MDIKKLNLVELTTQEQEKCTGGSIYKILGLALAAAQFGWQVGWDMGVGVRRRWFY